MDMINLLWAWFAIWLVWLCVSVAELKIAKKSVELLGKNPDLSWSLMVFTILGIALVESAAIYALIVSLQMIDADSLVMSQVIGAALAIWLAWASVSLAEWWVVENALDALNRNPEAKGKIMTFMILFVALVESAAIYGLIVALNILG